MQVKKLETGYLIRLDRGEEVATTLSEWAGREGVGAAFLWGFGALEGVELGFYNLKGHRYDRQTLPGEVELDSLTGTLSLLEGKPFLHAHVTVSGPDMVPRAGHLFRATVSVTGEFFVVATGNPVGRRLAPEVGLHLLELS